MIYHLTHLLKPTWHALNVFHYVSVRVICALLSALTASFFFGNWFVEASKKNFRTKVREYVPSTHLKKNDTPTMGGLFILLIVLFNTLLWNNLTKSTVWIFLACLGGFGVLGFLDDWAKIKSNKGISARSKFLLQLFVSLAIMGSWYLFSSPDTRLVIPFFKNWMPTLGLLIIPWGVLILIATSNAVNLTDGLDGLAAGPLMCNFITFSAIAYLAGHRQFAHYLHIPFVASSELSIIGATLIGCLLGFLWYNTYPAQIFMGDVGSLTLGAGLGLLAIMTRQELLLPLAGGIFVLETLSVMMQVASFKLFGKRIFRMAPIHHHFELMGWSEPKITVRFWIISLILSLLTLLTLKIR